MHLENPTASFCRLLASSGYSSFMFYDNETCIANVSNDFPQVGRQLMTGLSTMASKLPKAWSQTTSWNISCYWYIWYVLSIYLEYLTKHNPEQTAKSTLTNCLVWSVVSVLYQVYIWCNLLVKIFQAAKEKKTQECPVVLWKNIFYAENNLLVYLTAQTRLHCTCVFSSGCWKPTVRNGCYRHVLIRQRQRNNQTKGWPSTLL